jgi:hypothetical protein
MHNLERKQGNLKQLLLKHMETQTKVVASIQATLSCQSAVSRVQRKHKLLSFILQVLLVFYNFQNVLGCGMTGHCNCLLEMM